MDVPEEVQVAVGTPNLFDVLRMQPALGRSFRPREGAPGAGNVLVVTRQHWERRFDLDPEILGRTLTLDGTPHTVVGVMPKGFEMLPAGVQALRPTDMKEALEEGSRGGTAGRQRKRLRNVFVVGQLAVALALLTGAAELREVMNAVVFSENGFESDRVLTFQLSLPDYKYQGSEELRLANEEILLELRRLTGVEEAALLTALPRGRRVPNSFFSLEGEEYQDPNMRPRANWDAVSPSFFRTLGIPLAALIHQAVLSTGSLFNVDTGVGVALVAGGILVGVAIVASYLPARSAAKVPPTQALTLE